MTLKLYYDLMSQPSRSLYILLKVSKCDFEPKFIDLRKGEHYSNEYAKINRFQKVPVIDHNGFVLSESVAILRYLSGENLIPPSLYPKDNQIRARVDEFLEWHHIEFRLHLSMYFRVKHMDPIITGIPPNPKTLKGYERRLISALETFESQWLKNGNEFITGNNITVADLFAASELEQPRMAGYNPAERFLRIGSWWKNVREHFSPYYDEGHVILNKIVNKQKQQSSKL
ncbi:glutathione S-transferase theta 1 [Danaus plexippus plexippus]|uniref:Glutathione S-transferase theta 1 n=1 Tax=Danaus plexippus plexippus TaxID=278856 RepID=A0A212EZ10_DANPL|nr:glutathione S-transferase theta-1-like [Danaus plexippus plexippus]OWR46701.1 glutathione S-transferase theta 1 [Danaus plexippus plexippus]